MKNNILNVEIKAKCSHQQKIRNYLTQHQARSLGTDHQIDTYFVVPEGRLKLRQGNVENSLIFYQRSNQAGPKDSFILLEKFPLENNMLAILSKVMKVLKVVDKKREIYFIDNVKFHLDNVQGLGTFMEIEAIDEQGTIGKEKLLQQCQFYMKEFEIKEADLLSQSYSDML